MSIRVFDGKEYRDATSEELVEIENEHQKMRREEWLNTTNAPTEANRVEISREDFDLLDVTDRNTIYTIIENDGSVTVRKGED